MVLRGQFLERPALVEVDGLTLEGLYHRGERRPALLVCPPLAELGGMDAPPIAELAWACARAGHASLRFQHRGQGASQGRPDPGAALDDAYAALRHLRESAASPKVAVAGYRSGAATALRLAERPEVGPVAIICPLAAEASAEVLRRTLAIFAEETPSAERGPVEEAVRAAGGRVEIVPRTDHTFRVGLPEVGRRVAEWTGAGATGSR